MMTRLLSALLISLLASAAAAGTDAGDSGDAAMADTIRLTITSTAPGTAFTATCTVTHGGRETVEDHSGTAPVTLDFEAEGLRCEIASDGPLEIVGEGPRGNTTRTATSGGRVVLSLS